MSRILRSAVGIFFLTTLLAIPFWGQSQPASPAGPVPPQITAAKKIFISNLGEENYHFVTSGFYSGGPNRAYNQFYDAMKTWGQ